MSSILKARGYAVSFFLVFVPTLLVFTYNAPVSALFSQYVGLAALIAMAISQFIATRLRLVEPLFGPLDRAYILHKWMGILALATILIHENVDPEVRGLGAKGALNELAEGLGEQSYNLLLILIIITLISIVPYRLWYWTHRFMGVVFVLGAAHIIFIQKPFSNFSPLGLYVLAVSIIGIAASIYALLPRAMRKSHAYEVTHIKKTGNALAVSMKPKSGKGIYHFAGQFAFFTPEVNRIKETHPFTISSAPREDGSLRVSIAQLGDYTRKLEGRLKLGDEINVQGAFGHFKAPKRKHPQAWIAGGVGITPFLAWLDAASHEGPPVDLFYCYRGNNATHLDELKEKAAANPRVTLHLFDTNNGPRLSANAIREACPDKKTIFAFCGPIQLRESLRTQLGGKWIYEEFEIRTGLPFISKAIGKLAKRLWAEVKSRTGIASA